MKESKDDAERGEFLYVLFLWKLKFELLMLGMIEDS